MADSETQGNYNMDRTGSNIVKTSENVGHVFPKSCLPVIRSRSFVNSTCAQPMSPGA